MAFLTLTVVFSNGKRLRTLERNIQLFPNPTHKGNIITFTFQSSFVGAIAIGDLVKSTLGPKGMDKILQGAGQNDTLQVTNDGATILRAIGVDNPAAKVLVGE